MDPLPDLDIPNWPDKKNGVYTVDEVTAVKFSVVLSTLVSYVLEQQSKCLRNANEKTGAYKRAARYLLESSL